MVRLRSADCNADMLSTPDAKRRRDIGIKPIGLIPVGPGMA
jgi:hypothetical protein